MMKKLFVLLLLSLLVFSGCHGKKGVPDDGETFHVDTGSFNEEKNYEITFWAKNDTNVAQTAIYEKAIADFEELYPNITVKYKPYTDYRRIYNDVITNIATDTTPNVCITYPDHIATYITGGDTVVPLDALMADENYGLGGKKLRFVSPQKHEIVEKFLQEGKISGTQYALPFMRSTEACYINKTFVEKLGFEIPENLTWDFVWDVSEAAMQKDDNGNFAVNGQKVMIPFIYKSTDNMMIQMLYQQSAPYASENGEVLVFNDYTKQILMDVATHAHSRAFSTFKISSYPANFLNAGQCIFAVDSTAGATWMGKDAPNCDISEDNIVDFETVIMPVPQYDTENPKMISQGPSVCVFNKEDDGEVVAAWLFTQFLLTNDVQIAYSQTEGYVPVTHMAQNSSEYSDYISREGEDNDLYYDIKIKAAKLLSENTDNTFTTPVFNGSADLRSAAGEMIEIVTKSVRRGQTVNEKFIEGVFDEASSLYRLESIEPGLSSPKKADFGPLPTGAKALIISLVSVWIILIVYAVASSKKRR
ncbi:MAG: extracellular solute-binding protein [Clostridia bacterium]|nr:extracellular solute-binding protein [Clostridia bacterium]